MAGSLKVNVSFSPSLDTFRKRFDAKRMAAAPLRKGFEAFGDKTKARAQRYARPHPGGDNGALAESIDTDLRGQAFDLIETTSARKEYAEDAELGRRPGRPPSSTVMASWLRRHGKNPRYGFVLARRIGREGTRGLHYLKRGIDDTAAKDAPAIFNKVADEIEANWRRG